MSGASSLKNPEPEPISDHRPAGASLLEESVEPFPVHRAQVGPHLPRGLMP
jgi:hypothetical protein